LRDVAQLGGLLLGFLKEKERKKREKKGGTAGIPLHTSTCKSGLLTPFPLGATPPSGKREKNKKEKGRVGKGKPSRKEILPDVLAYGFEDEGGREEEKRKERSEPGFHAFSDDRKGSTTSSRPVS